MTETRSIYRYRWVVLWAVFPMIVTSEIMWLSIAPISSVAQEFYGVGASSIDVLSISFMAMFILFSVPSAWVIDRFGFRTSLIIGALLTAIFGLMRAAFADTFAIVLIAQFLIAIGQPFLLNISTKVPANWFPIGERSTAAGILTMAQYVGFAIPMLLSPMLAESHGIPRMLWIYALIGVAAAIVSISLTRERPPSPPPGPAPAEEVFSLASVRSLARNQQYVLVLVVCFVSIGVFNTILTVLESILLPHGITSAQAGIVGAIFVIAGVFGAVVLPMASDKIRIRIPFLLAATAILIPAYLGFAFIGSFPAVAILAGVGGFMIMGAAPILFQHGSEVAYPVQEGTSLSMILIMGQFSGILFVALFEILHSAAGGPTLPMLGIVVATALVIPVILRMRESGVVARTDEHQDGGLK